jgi:signal transduction histidine kinase
MSVSPPEPRPSAPSSEQAAPAPESPPRALLDRLTDAFLTVDADWQLTYLNPSAAALLNRPREELRGACLWTLPLLGRAPLRSHCTSAVAEDRTAKFMLHGTSDRSLEVRAYPLANGLALFVEDVTDRVAARRALETAKDDAERANARKAAFFSNVTHDLRTPLTSILGSVEMLAPHVPDAHQDSLQRIERSAQRLLETINSVLNLSKLETGAVEPDWERIDLADEVLGTAEIFRPQASEQNITLNAEVDPAHIAVDLDPTLLHRILDNLVSNALKFTDAGGTVTLRAQATDAAVVVEVVDTGVGIDEAFLPHLFESFARGDEAGEQVGSGLGLPITKRLTELMGGAIRVESERGAGTTFTVRLPRSPRTDEDPSDD